MELQANEEIDHVLLHKKKVKKLLFVITALFIIVIIGALNLWRVSQNPNQHNIAQQESNNAMSLVPVW